MNARAKGGIGHKYTREWLENDGWSCIVQPHRSITWKGNDAVWYESGSNDFFSIPVEGEDKKREGGFDILAFKAIPEQEDLFDIKLIQVKKTKKNPITPSLIALLRRCADHHRLPYSICFIYWWPDGVGPARGPVIKCVEEVVGNAV